MLAVAVCTLAAVIPGLASLAVAAPPSVTSLFPPGVPRGATTQVQATGTLDPWPLNVWCDREGVSIVTGKKKGELSITVADDVPPGVVLVRLYNSEGASALKPLMIGHLPEMNEKEPNDAVSQAQKIDSEQLAAAGVTINGRYDKSGDVDAYAVQLRAGQTLVAAIESNFTLGKKADPSLQVASERGFVQAHNDDARGMDPMVIFTAPADGTYLVRTFCFPAEPNSTIQYAGGADLLYRLTLSTAGYIDHVMPMAVSQDQSTKVEPRGWNLDGLQPLTVTQPQPQANDDQASREAGEKAEEKKEEKATQEKAAKADETTIAIAGDTAVLYWPKSAGVVTVPRVPYPVVLEKEPNNDIAQAESIQWPVVVSGTIGTADDRDFYRFQAARGDNLSMKVDSWKLGYELDVHLTLRDESGKVIRELDDTVRDQREADLVYRFTAAGQYILEVRDLYHHGGPRYPYRLTIAPAEPDYSLSVAADRFTIPADKPLEIPVTVTRTNGFAGEITVRVANLPEGVECEPVKSAPTGDSAKSVKLVLKATEGAKINGPLQIEGEGAHQVKGAEKPGPTLQRAATATVEGTTWSSSHLWLAVEAPKKEAAKDKK